MLDNSTLQFLNTSLKGNSNLHDKHYKKPDAHQQPLFQACKELLIALALSESVLQIKGFSVDQ